MSTTARAIIKSSLRLIGVTAAGENPSAEEQADAFTALNNMLDSWSTESLVLFKKTIETFPITPSQVSYTMGVGGNFNTSKPLKISHIATLDASGTPAQEIPMEILNLDQWSRILQKLLTSTIATKAYMDFTYPLLTIYPWPIPTVAKSFVIYSEKPLVDPANVDAVIDLPPGYAMAIIYNLAVLLTTEYGKQLDQAIVGIALTAKGNIERMNIQPLYMDCDPAIVSRGSTWDWRTGE